MGVLGTVRVDGLSQEVRMGEREGRLRPGMAGAEAKIGEAVEEEGEGEGVKGLARKIWMGDEGPGWQKRRLEREKEELGKGRGYGDIIMEQVREVFPGFGGGRRGEGEGEKES